MAEGDVAEQARLTIENILNLLPAGKAPVFEMFIIYLKYEQDFTIVKKLTDGILPETSPVYVLANLCRDELLVEMEGWVSWSGIVGAMGGTVDWGHGADCDGGGRWELAMDGL